MTVTFALALVFVLVLNTYVLWKQYRAWKEEDL